MLVLVNRADASVCVPKTDLLGDSHRAAWLTGAPDPVRYAARAITGQSYTCRVTVTGIGAERQGGDSHLPPAGDGRLTPEQAAQLLFDDPRAKVNFEARDEAEARAAVEEFAQLFEKAPGVFKDALDGARAGAETLSHDRLQGLAEIIQNADDAAASYVEFRVRDRHLIAVHDGRLVTLSDVLSLATPWLSNKTDDVLATGRYGIGLMTLRALSDVLDVHSGLYHIRLGEPMISAIDIGTLPCPLPEPMATALCLPLHEGLDADELADWLGRWDDSALLFLRHVKRVAVFDSDGAAIRTLRLKWSEDESATCIVGGQVLAVQRRHARAPDGRAWLVHSAEAPTPQDVSRVRKASAATDPLGLALPLQPEDNGVIYAGLPLAGTSVPLRVNAQFDPVTSRTGLAPTRWNSAMLPLLADLWVEVVEDLFLEMPVVAWNVVPLSGEADGHPGPASVVEELERLLLDRARTELAARAAIAVEGTRLTLTELAVEEPVLENVIGPSDVAALADLGAALPMSARDTAGRWRSVLDDWRSAGALLPEPVTVKAALVLLNDVSRTPEATIRLTAVALGVGLADRLLRFPCVMTADGARVAPPTAGSLQALLLAPSALAEQLGVGVRLAADHLVQSEAAQTVLTWLRQIGAVIDDPGNEEVVRRLAAAGRAGNCLAEPLTDSQLRALRDAFESLPPGDRVALGGDVGQAITIDAYRYDTRGQTVHTTARPVHLYLSRAIDREPDSFATAADRTPRLLWTHNRYAEQLRSALGRPAALVRRSSSACSAPSGPHAPSLIRSCMSASRASAAAGWQWAQPAVRRSGTGSYGRWAPRTPSTTLTAPTCGRLPSTLPRSARSPAAAVVPAPFSPRSGGHGTAWRKDQRSTRRRTTTPGRSRGRRAPSGCGLSAPSRGSTTPTASRGHRSTFG